MFRFKFSKARPLQIKNTVTGDIIEILVPPEYNRTSMTVGLNVDSRYQVKMKPLDDGDKEQEESCKNFNK